MMSQDMVYAIYPFKSEREDELDLEYGEVIIVLEKDEMYGDGWWMGQNMIGNVGLFPMNYTSYNRPRNKLDNKDFRNNKIPIITRPNADYDQNSNLNDTIRELQNELQLMIDNNNNYEESFDNNNNNNNNNKRTRKHLSSKSRLSTTSTNTNSYYSARNSLLQHQHHQNSQFDLSELHKNSSRTSIHNNNNLDNKNDNIRKSHPSSWDVYRVCQWLSENGFDSETKKFLEYNITGDALLKLNPVSLKELDINSFGKRAHLLNTIALLKEQHSIDNDDNEFHDHVLDKPDGLDNLNKNKSLASKALSKSQFGSSDINNINPNKSNHSYSIADDTFVNNPNRKKVVNVDTFVNNRKINDQKKDFNLDTFINNRKLNDQKNDINPDTFINKINDRKKDINPDTSVNKINDRKRNINPVTFNPVTFNSDTFVNMNGRKNEDTFVNNQIFNDLKSDINPSTYYNVPPPPSERPNSPPSENPEKPHPPPSEEKPKIRKKTSRTFLSYFTKSKSDNTKSNHTKSDITKSNITKPDITKSNNTKSDITKSKSDITKSNNIKSDNTKFDNAKSDNVRFNNTRSLYTGGGRNPTTDKSARSLSVHDEFFAYSNEEEYATSQFISGRRKNATLHIDRGLVGNQLDFLKRFNDEEKNYSENRSSMIYGYNVNNINENNEVIKSVDHEGLLKKQGEMYRNWKNRFCVLKGITLYYYKSEKKSKIKGHINLTGYKIIPDEHIYQGKYGFKLLHETERPHFFAHEDLTVIKGWTRAIMKATLDINLAAPLTTSYHIQTVPLSEAHKVANRMPRPAPSLPNLLAINPNHPTYTIFSGLPPRPAPSPPLSSLPKPKAPPTGELPPRPKSSNLSSSSSSNSNSHKDPQSPNFAPHTKHLTTYNQNSINKTPKFPSMSLSMLRASTSSTYSNEIDENSMGSYI